MSPTPLGPRVRRRLGRARRSLLVRASGASGRVGAVPADRLPIIGLTRFSVLTRYGWTRFQRSTGSGVATFDEYAQHHLSPRRLRYRLDVLLGDGLPQLMRSAQRFPLYRHVVAHSTLLPDEVLAELRAAAEAYRPHLVLDPVPPDGSPGQRARPWLRGLPWPTAAPDTLFAVFRVDDDDVLAADYLERLAAYTVPAEFGRCVSFGTGYAVPYDVDTRRPLGVRRAYEPKTSAGLAYVGSFSPRSGRVASAHDYPPGRHLRVDEQVPTVLDSREPAWLRLHSDDQITSGAQQRTFEQRLARWPEASWSDVVRAFPASRLVADAVGRAEG